MSPLFCFGIGSLALPRVGVLVLVTFDGHAVEDALAVVLRQDELVVALVANPLAHLCDELLPLLVGKLSPLLVWRLPFDH